MSMARILIVEDERLVAAYIEKMVVGLGYEVAGVVSTGEDAVREAIRESPDLVLMDIMLRGSMDGITASDEIRKRAPIPIIFLTAYADGQTIERAKATEPSGYLLKPFEEKDLHTAIEISLHKHRVNMQLKERERWLSTILASISDGVVSADGEERIGFMNAVAESLIGRTKDDCLGKKLADVLHLVDEKSGRRIRLSLPGGDGRNKIPALEGRRLLLIRKDRRMPVEIGAASIGGGTSAGDGVVLLLRDISQQREEERKLAFQAIHDPLTELPNRILFNDRLTLALTAAARRKQMIAVLMLDLDHFKEVNDTLGHAAGDLLLKSVGNRLFKLLRKSDTIARIGGDEFIVLLPDILRVEMAVRVAGRIQRALKRALNVGERKIPVSASIGIAVYPGDGENAETLTRNADIAMYAAKEAGRNTYRLYSRIPSLVARPGGGPE